ncbi:hypothetical protein [Mucilaginibacter lacusdianchii]|uniref:hypothetical protein n=1 Tax=Mucilaginibacter lacusdianchii TaxID=2684211 RepID=UPI00131AC1E7|nr:hypothetical protein [Mucilaginibacter sp. JXJ CY 39]
MNYRYEPVSQTKAVIELIPVTDQEKTLLKQLNINNPEHEMTFHYYFEKGLQSRNVSAVLLGIDKMIEPPTKALVSFEVVIGLGS